MWLSASGRLHTTAVPCTRDIFERLLEESGHLIADGLVSGLILRADFEWASGLKDGAICSKEITRNPIINQ